jgi:hypothetical protein
MTATVAAAPHPPTRNLLLGSLPDEDYGRLQPHFEPVVLPLGWAVYESGDRLAHVFFPTEGIVSREKVTEKIDKISVFGGLDAVLKDLVKIR